MTRRVTAISGLNEASQVAPSTAVIGWSIVIGVTVLVFAGTLLLKPGKA